MKKKLKGIVVAAATLALAAVMLAGCSGGGDAQKSDEGKAGDAPFTLTVGFDQGYPPYGYVGDDGQFTGFDLELAKAVCEKNGWELKLEPIDWDAKDALIGSGTINCIWNGFTMENRENDYTFSEPYMYNEQVVVVKKDGDAKKLEDLAGKTVLVIAHRMRTVEAADKIVVLADGKAAEQGSPTELMEKGGLFRRMVELQRQSASWKLG